MPEPHNGGRTSIDAALIEEWMASLQLRWLPRHPADRPLRTANPDHQRLLAAVPRWETLLRTAVRDPHGDLPWRLDPAAGRSVQVVDAYLAGFALALASALRIPPDPDIADSQPIVMATAMTGAAAVLERLEVIPDLAEVGSAAADTIWRSELAIATAASGAAIDLGSNGGSLAEVTRIAAAVALDVADGRSGPGYEVVVVLQALADVVSPPAELTEDRNRYEVRFWFDLPGETLPSAAEAVRDRLASQYRVGNILELDVEERPAQGESCFTVRILTRRAGPLVQAIYDYDRPEDLSIEVR